MSEQLISIDELKKEIDIFENEMALRRNGKIDEKIFAETRLRRGVYGQRYDNGQRHNGNETRTLKFKSGEVFKGPETYWDAPGMMRIKIPFGNLNAKQLEVMAELAEEYSDGIAHVTTRQDFQLHYVHIDDTPGMMRRLAEAGITTREACGNSVRNVTACPVAGVCNDERFDVTPYAHALAKFLLGHPDAQDFGRKFKVAFSGCAHNGCGLTAIHDLGLIGVQRTNDGKTERGFKVYVGGGLGAVPYQSQLYDEFLPESELLPLAQAIARVFARLGEKKNRARARIKFLVDKMGIEAFRKEVQTERELLRFDPRWKELLTEARAFREEPLNPGGSLNGDTPEGFQVWYKTNVYRQRQTGYSTVTIKLPLGDITSHQLRLLADITRRYTKDTIRTTVEQNIVLRWISDSDLTALYRDLQKARLASAGAGKIEDIVACPGTDTCKLGIASSRGLAAELQNQFANGLLSENGGSDDIDDIIRDLHIKISGCFNSCGQHHIADLGFYGISRKSGSHTVPHFQVVLGGQWTENAGSYGLPVGAVPSRRIPDFVRTIVLKYKNEREEAENFQDYIKRIGKVSVKKVMQEFTTIPAYAQDKSFYSDWGDPREFSIGDMGVGECAGEVVSQVEFELTAAEREVFEAQIALDEEGDATKAGASAYKAMLKAARALVLTAAPYFPDDPEKVIAEFKIRFFDTELFFDKYAGGKFARYLFLARDDAHTGYSAEQAYKRIGEAQLFVEAAYACYLRLHDSNSK